MVIRDPSRGPNSRSRRCDRALGHRSHNRPSPDHIESPDSPPIVAASLKDTCRTCQRRRAQSDPPQMSHFVSRRCDRTIGPITRLWGSLWAHLSLREGGENRTRTDRKTRLESRSIIPFINHNRRARQGVFLTVKRLSSPEKASERPTNRGRLGWGVTHWPDLEAARQGRPGWRRVEREYHGPCPVSGAGRDCWHCQVNESGTYEGRLIRDQAAVTAVHTVNARARNIR